MAPTLPSHRTARPARSILKSTGTTTTTSSSTKSPTNKTPKPTSSSSSSSTSLFPINKADKRRIKHANIVSKVHKSTPAATKNAKRRRNKPSKKLVATLDELADALPDTTDSETPGAALNSAEAASQVNVIKRKSLKSKPGALKRRQKEDNAERERWGKNLGLLNVVPKTTTADGDDSKKGQAASSTQDRWAALRGFIGQTLERRPDAVVASTG